MWHVSALYRPCIGHRTGYSLHENARISGLASADFEGVFAHSYKRWRPRLFLRALRKEGPHAIGSRPKFPVYFRGFRNQLAYHRLICAANLVNKILASLTAQ